LIARPAGPSHPMRWVRICSHLTTVWLAAGCTNLTKAATSWLHCEYPATACHCTCRRARLRATDSAHHSQQQRLSLPTLPQYATRLCKISQRPSAQLSPILSVHVEPPNRHCHKRVQYHFSYISHTTTDETAEQYRHAENSTSRSRFLAFCAAYTAG